MQNPKKNITLSHVQTLLINDRNLTARNLIFLQLKLSKIELAAEIRDSFTFLLKKEITIGSKNKILFRNSNTNFAYCLTCAHASGRRRTEGKPPEGRNIQIFAVRHMLNISCTTTLNSLVINTRVLKKILYSVTVFYARL